MAPGPTPTLTMSAPASTRSCTPSAATTLPATTGTFGSSDRTAREGLEHPLLVAVGGVDDQAVDAGRQQTPGLLGDVAVDADRGRDPQPAVLVEGGAVDRRAQRADPGEDPDQCPVVVHGRGQAVPRGGEHVEGLAWLHRVLERDHVGGHHVRDLGEPVDPEAVGLGDHPDRPAVLEHDGGPMRALGQQGQGVTDRVLGLQRDRGLEHRVARLHPRDHLLDDPSGMSCGRTLIPPRRAIVSAIRRPDTAVMFATTIGIVVPVPSFEARSTS